MSTEPFVIEVNHLVHKYGRTEAINDLSLRVRRGHLLQRRHDHWPGGANGVAQAE